MLKNTQLQTRAAFGYHRVEGEPLQLAWNIVGNGSSIPPGHSDLVATLAPDGIALCIEVKAPAWIDERGKQIRGAGSPTVEQLEFLLAKHRRRAIALVAYSVDDVTNHLRDRLQRNFNAVRSEGR